MKTTLFSIFKSKKLFFNFKLSNMFFYYFILDNKNLFSEIIIIKTL